MGVAVSYERGNPVSTADRRHSKRRVGGQRGLVKVSKRIMSGARPLSSEYSIQGYLAHEKPPPPPRTTIGP